MDFIVVEWRVPLKFSCQHMIQLMLYQAIIKGSVVLKMKQLFQAVYILFVNP